MPFRATMLLADSAQAVENKLYILGGGWDVTGPAPVPCAIAMLIQVSWDLTNRRHHWRLELVDSDGQPVQVSPAGGETVAVEGEFEVGRPVGVAPGSWLAVPLAINFAPIPLTPGNRYEWRLTVADQSDEDWRLPFAVRESQP